MRPGGAPRVSIRTLGITTRVPGFVVPSTRQQETYAQVELTGEGTFIVS